MTKIIIVLLVLVQSVWAQSIQSGGAIQVSFQGIPAAEQQRLNASYSVSSSGHIRMWQIGTLKASGLSVNQLAVKIENAYKAAEIYTDPTVQIIADSSDTITQQLVTVGGHVKAPGDRPYQRNMTLFQAVMASGGPTAFGAVNRVTVFRNGKQAVYDMNRSEHKLIKVFPGDTINVPQKNWRGQ